MKCAAKGCNGEIGTESVAVHFADHTEGTAHACKKCSRMHHLTGHLMFNGLGYPVFWIAGRIVLGKREKTLVHKGVINADSAKS